MVIYWTDKAKQHLHNIFDYYAEVASSKIASKLVADITTATYPLAKFPQMAPVESALVEFPQEFRSLLVRKKYKVIYFVENESIHIVAVWNCRQNPDNLKNVIMR
jgi:plasmid stabilization system protein ParE